MQSAPISLSVVLTTPLVSLPVQLLLFLLQESPKNAEELQAMVVKWFPLIMSIGLTIVCIALVAIAIFLYDISETLKKKS